MAFPEYRARRLRDHAIFREMVAETSLEPRRLAPFHRNQKVGSRH